MGLLSSIYWVFTRRKTSNSKISRGDEIMTQLMGSFGKYQLLLYFLTVTVKIPLAFQMFAQIFLAPKTTTFVGDNGTKGECPASHPKYNSPIFSKNIIVEWNLICDHKWMQGFSQTMFQFGNLVGSIVFGALSDRYGRRWPMIIACGGECFAGIIGAFMPTYWTYTFMRFLVGFFVAGTLVISYVIVMEFMGSKHRAAFAPLIQVPFTIGHMLIPLVAYFHDNYQKFLLFISATASVFILFIFLLPETPRWLLAMKKTERCIKIVEKVAKTNKLPTSEIRTKITEYHRNITAAETKTRKGNCLDLLKYSSMRKHVIICCFEWLTLGFTFYGLAQYVGSFGGNVYINVEISAIVNCMGAAIGIPILNRFGRKSTSFACFLVCSLCTLLMTFIYNDIARVVLSSIAIFCDITAWSAAYLFTSELFPTVVRSAALGSSSMMARVGSMIAPLIIDLGDTHKWLPPLIFGFPSLLVTFLIMCLPETKGLDLMTTLQEEKERFGKKRAVTFNAGNQFPTPPPSPPTSQRPPSSPTATSFFHRTASPQASVVSPSSPTPSSRPPVSPTSPTVTHSPALDSSTIPPTTPSPTPVNFVPPPVISPTRPVTFSPPPVLSAVLPVTTAPLVISPLFPVTSSHSLVISPFPPVTSSHALVISPPPLSSSLPPVHSSPPPSNPPVTSVTPSNTSSPSPVTTSPPSSNPE